MKGIPLIDDRGVILRFLLALEPFSEGGKSDGLDRLRDEEMKEDEDRWIVRQEAGI